MTTTDHIKPASASCAVTAVRRALLHLWFILPFSAVCAAVVTYVMRLGDGYGENLVFSLCISIAALVLIDGGQALFWRNRKPAPVPFLLLVLAAIPVAQLSGTIIASLILHLPPHNVLANQSHNLVALVILVALATSFAVWFFSNRMKVATLTAEAEAEKSRAAVNEKQAMQAQLQLLQTQIEPHMLFNTLANLQGLIATDAPRAQRMLDQLIQYLRATLSSSRVEKTTLAQEFTLMEAYLGLMTVRMGSRLCYALHLPEVLRDATIPPMLLQPLVENAVKHGIEPKLEGGGITVEASQENGVLVLTVADTGLGLDLPPGMEGSHIGLTNVRERLQALFGEKASLSLSPNTPCGAVARIIIPS